MTSHRAGTTPRFEWEVRDYDGKYCDPDTHSGKIYNSSDVLQKEETNPSKTVEGDREYFYFYWTIPADAEKGTWKLQVTCVKSSYTTIEELTFEVV